MTYRIEVTRLDGTKGWGAPTGEPPYEFADFRSAERAARLWGDAYSLLGLVRVIEYTPPKEEVR